MEVIGERMTVLSDVDIIKEIEKKNLKIDPFSQNNLTPNGYDLSIREIMIPELVKTVDSGEVVIPARMWFAAATRERLKLYSTHTAHKGTLLLCKLTLQAAGRHLGKQHQRILIPFPARLDGLMQGHERILIQCVG